MNRLATPMAALFILAASAYAADDVKSGLEVGESAGVFHVKDVTGPNKGKSHCYRWSYGGGPVVVVFAREITDSLTSLVKSIDAQVGEKKLKAFVVLLTDDVDAATKKLADVAKENDIKNTPLTIYEGVSGPEKYKIAKDAEVTVLMWNKRVVRANHAFAKGKLTDEAVKTVVGDTSKIQNWSLLIK